MVPDHAEQFVKRQHAALARARRAANQLVRGPWQFVSPAGEIHLRHRRDGELADHAASVGSPVDAPVVHAHQVAVPADPDIAFEGIGALFEGQFVSTAGVLGVVCRGASVRNNVGGRLPHGAHYGGDLDPLPAFVTHRNHAVLVSGQHRPASAAATEAIGTRFHQVTSSFVVRHAAKSNSPGKDRPREWSSGRGHRMAGLGAVSGGRWSVERPAAVAERHGRRGP